LLIGSVIGFLVKNPFLFIAIQETTLDRRSLQYEPKSKLHSEPEPQMNNSSLSRPVLYIFAISSHKLCSFANFTGRRRTLFLRGLCVSG
jgi:hypothetical protein